LHLDGPLAAFAERRGWCVRSWLPAAPFSVPAARACRQSASHVPGPVEPSRFRVFDVTTSLCAACRPHPRHYSDHSPWSTRVALSTIIAALLSKKRVVVPVLITVDAWALRRLTRPLIVDPPRSVCSLS
jgi:hypothetical protein